MSKNLVITFTAIVGILFIASASFALGANTNKSNLSPTAIASSSNSGQCAKTDEASVKGLFTRWNNSLQTLDPKKVVENYADDGVLLPTVSNTPRTNHAMMENYFEEFLLKKPFGTINSSTVRIDCNMAFDVGTYTFDLTDPATKVSSKVPARYSYVYRYIDGQWLIAHHHSSVMPEKNK
jgi:uncharacterized protein (TIGR02246 family)